MMVNQDAVCALRISALLPKRRWPAAPCDTGRKRYVERPSLKSCADRCFRLNYRCIGFDQDAHRCLAYREFGLKFLKFVLLENYLLRKVRKSRCSNNEQIIPAGERRKKEWIGITSPRGHLFSTDIN